MGEQSLKLSFPGGAGDMLAARLELPVGPPRAFALFAHCFTCSKDAAAASRVSRALCAQGFAVLRFDFTGLGNSQGDFANTTFSSNQDDLVAAADYLRGAYEAPALLVGHSLGGAAVLRAAERITEARAVVTIAAPSDPAHLLGALAPAVLEVARAGEAIVELGGRRFPIRRSFLEDLERHPLERAPARAGRALLVLHSPADRIVAIDEARRIFDAAAHPKSFVALDGADHLLAKREDALYAASVIAAWAARYVPERPAAAAGAPAPAGDAVVVREVGKYAQAIRAGRHVLTADEPASAGGEDTGPTPYGLLLAALGACTSMTLRMYADRKGWPLAGVEVALRSSRIHAKDCATCESDEGQVDRIERVIALTGELDAEQRARLLEIADRCPVHRTLAGEKEIVTRLEEPQAG